MWKNLSRQQWLMIGACVILLIVLVGASYYFRGVSKPKVVQNPKVSPTTTQTISPSQTPTLTVTPTVTLTPTVTPTVTPTPKPTKTPTPKPTKTPIK